MNEPQFTQHPTEIFGYPFTNKDSVVQEKRERQFCPFLNGECKKPRKSQPEVKIGVCTLGYKGKFSEIVDENRVSISAVSNRAYKIKMNIRLLTFDKFAALFEEGNRTP